MNRMLSPRLIFVVLVMLGTFGVAAAQNVPPPDGAKPPGGPPPKRPNLFALLNLSPAQLQQIRRINQERKPQVEAANARLNEANRALDKAIYDDNLDEAQVQTCLKERQAAQADVARLRFEGELQVRKILTPDQLARFRDLRSQYMPPRPPDGSGPGPQGDKMRPMQQMRRDLKKPIN